MDRALTILEATALGIVLKSGPCLAHTVLKQMSDSDTHAYRSGAGSVYPMLSRLQGFGYLNLEKRRYSLTDEGRDALRRWMMSTGDIGTNLDVLRTRCYFLQILSPAQRIEFLSRAQSELAVLLQRCEAVKREQKESGDRLGELAMLGAIYETRARMDWISEVLRALES